MKMKLFVVSVLIFFICNFMSNLVKCDASKSTFNLQNHLSMAMTFKVKTKTLLENLYKSANKVEFQNFNNKKVLKNSENDDEINFNERCGKRSLLKRKVNTNNLHHFSNLHGKTQHEYIQYRYKEYNEIVDRLFELAQQYPDLVKVNTAQKLYNLPHPGGYCNYDKKTPCEHYVVFLSNHKIDKKNKYSILLSGEVHGDEIVGPTASLELINLFIENKDHPWFKYLLDTRYMVIVPMTNPHGYKDKVREELLIKDEDRMVLTKRAYKHTHKDINRDFPYLVKASNCMITIGARVINELYINNLFLLALSLHGGTESLTYPYGTPNHLQSRNIPKIPMKYMNIKGKLTPVNSPEALNTAKLFRKGDYDMYVGPSNNPPDQNAVVEIAKSVNDHTTNNPKHRYPVGDMNSVVYPVTGGMEDWAYSGSWEGAPIITQPCKPSTYNGYDPNKTIYDKNYKDALKSIMFLLEVSHAKTPEQKKLGRKNLDCLINLRPNAFFNKVSGDTKTCLDDYIDGYIPRIIRLSLSLIDLLNPYVTFMTENINNTNLKVIWTVGGAIKVDSTYILYQYYPNKPTDAVIKEIRAAKTPIELFKHLKNKSQEFNGRAVWDINYTSNDRFNLTLNNIKNSGKYLVFVILAKVDQNWSLKNHPDPDVNPQTHIANLRTNSAYQATNGGFELEGKEFFKSEIKIINTKYLK